MLRVQSILCCTVCLIATRLRSEVIGLRRYPFSLIWTENLDIRRLFPRQHNEALTGYSCTVLRGYSYVVSWLINDLLFFPFPFYFFSPSKISLARFRRNFPHEL
jgi:hypothetical protein